jgi:hypothetical protein
MSRSYDIYLQVGQFQPHRREAIQAAAQRIWPFEWFSDTATLLESFGESSLCGGETDQEFAERLAQAIWQAHGGWCYVLVTATYLEDLPHETYEFDEDDYERQQAAMLKESP